MQKLSYILSIDNLKSVYYVYCHSLVKYVIISWGKKSDSHKFFFMQKKKKIKIMMRVGPTHTCRNLFKKLGILPIPCVYLHSLLIFVVNNTILHCCKNYPDKCDDLDPYCFAKLKEMHLPTFFPQLYVLPCCSTL
jgi:hypothetical protein